MENNIELRDLGADPKQVAPEIEQLTWKFWKKKRYIVISIIAGCMLILNMFKTALSVGIVAMTENTTIILDNGTEISERIFSWSYRERGFVLSSFFYGFIATQMIGGYMAAKFGGGLLLSTALLGTSCLTLCIPLAAKLGIYYLIALRALTGLLEGVTFPSMFELISHWIPSNERSRTIGICFAGNNLGNVICMASSGFISNKFGWESIFYFAGTPGILWYILWIIIVRDKPEDDRKISNDELRYIQQSIGHSSNSKLVVPWLGILTSRIVWALFIVQFCENWGFFTILTQLPTFLRDALGYNVENSGLLSALSYALYAISLATAGYIADFVPSKGYLTLKQTRRTFTCTAFLLQSMFMAFVVSFMHPIGSVIFIIIGVTFGGFTYPGFGATFFEIAPQYAGIIFSMSNTLAVAPGIISPILTGFVVQNKEAEEWQIVFGILAIFYVIGSLTYWFACTTEVQPWAKVKLNDIKESDTSSVKGGN